LAITGSAIPRWHRVHNFALTSRKRTSVIKQFAADVHAGKIAAEDQKRFEHLLLIGIGGSALGPQFVADALGSSRDPMDIHFFDNTDPDGFDRVFDNIGNYLRQTLVVVISKSGGTKETRNGMVEAETKFKEKGLQFAKHAVAVTGVGSELDKYAEKNEWLARFPMHDWVGGRTSVMARSDFFRWRWKVLTLTVFSRGRRQWTNGRAHTT
jgi:glucose-6-phosphate isomerase